MKELAKWAEEKVRKEREKEKLIESLAQSLNDDRTGREMRFTGGDVTPCLKANGVTIQDDHHWATEQAYKNGYAKGYADSIEMWSRQTENEELKFMRQFIHEHGLEFALASAWNKRAKED